MQTVEAIHVLNLIELSLKGGALVRDSKHMPYMWLYGGFCDWLNNNCGLFCSTNDCEDPEIYSKIYAIKELLWDSFLRLYPEKKFVVNKSKYWFPINSIAGRLSVVIHTKNRLLQNQNIDA